MPPKRKILVGRDATEDFQKRRKFNEVLQSLTIRVNLIQFISRTIFDLGCSDSFGWPYFYVVAFARSLFGERWAQCGTKSNVIEAIVPFV
jgi:hypothetical protein